MCRGSLSLNVVCWGAVEWEGFIVCSFQKPPADCCWEQEGGLNQSCTPDHLIGLRSQARSRNSIRLAGSMLTQFTWFCWIDQLLYNSQPLSGWCYRATRMKPGVSFIYELPHDVEIKAPDPAAWLPIMSPLDLYTCFCIDMFPLDVAVIKWQPWLCALPLNSDASPSNKVVRFG